jgi:hypothetical protein
MPDTEGARSSGIKPAAPGSQIERSRIAAVPAPQEQILPKTPRAGKSRSRTIPEVTPKSAPVKPTPDPAAKEASEKAKLREEAELAKVELARQQAERRAEAMEAAGRLSAVKNELATALSQASAIEKSQMRDRIAGVAVALVLAALVAFSRLPASRARVQAALPAPHQQASIVSEIRLQKERGPVSMARSLDRLNFVIASAGLRPQDVLLAVRASGGADRCPFVWADGQVSLIYRNGMAMSSVTDTLSRCAEAVELLPTDRMR